MQISDFKKTLTAAEPPADLPSVLQALWFDANDDWDRAHELAQLINTAEGSWVHAYLHRVEGDLNNARYWYRRAGREVPSESLSEEWDKIAAVLLSSASA